MDPNAPLELQWTGIVEDYSQRKLSRENDKLPALAGLAKTVAAASGDTYLAGLWERHLIAHLAWIVYRQEVGLMGCRVPGHDYWCFAPAHDSAKPPESKSEVKLPAKYRAPSWSWAALDARVLFTKLNSNWTVAVCTGSEVLSTGSGPFGGVRYGRLRLRVS